jgi:putative Holliday junction resolvase
MPRILGVDYGERRVGCAVSDEDAVVALPVRTLEVRGDEAAADFVLALCREKEATRIVVGLPVNMDGNLGPMAVRTQAFVDRLRSRTTLPVETWDERLTTQAAERVLLSADMSRARRKNVRDRIAAQFILQGYLDARAFRDAQSSGT